MPDRPIEARPQEDIGHDTALWFAYQYSCTVRDCLAMLTSAVPWVLCEWHTDFICAGPDGVPPHCLVSVKHRKPDQGPWPLSEMAQRGGLGVLYKRWNESGRKHNCRWITNGGLRPGELQTKNLSKLLTDRGPEFDFRITEYADFLKSGISADTIEDATAFLVSLAIFSTGGDAHSFRAQVVEEAARPILAQLGVRPGLAHTAYRATHELVVEAVHGLDPDNCTVTWYTGDEALCIDIARRKITRERLLLHLAKNGIAIPLDNGSLSRNRESIMIRKLRAGGLGPTVLAAAPRIRQQWYELEVSMRPDIPSPHGDDIGRIRADVAFCAGEAESKYRTPGTLYGVQMHRELAAQLSRVSPRGRIRLTQTELLGCAYQLTDECEIWLSDEFDPSTDAPWVAQSGTSFTQEELPFE